MLRSGGIAAEGVLGSIIGGGSEGNGINSVAENVPVVMAKLFETMKLATGVDLAEIIKADTYDAKVTKNINVTGLSNSTDKAISDNIIASEVLSLEE